MQELEAQSELRVLICAPKGRDAALIEGTLHRVDVTSAVVADMKEVGRRLQCGAGAVVVTEEALANHGLQQLKEVLQRQEAWSDLPIILLTSGGSSNSERTWHLVSQLGPAGNISLLERPIRTMTMISAVQTALRSRKRQYEVRALTSDLEHRVQERTRELERLMKEAEGFSYTMSHDLRAPLRSIVGQSQMLLEDYSDILPAEAQDHLSRQSAAANNLARLIDDLLKLSRLSREQLTPQAIDLTDIARDSVRELQAEFPEGRWRFDVQEGLKANGDPLLMRIALGNLLHNAAKFSPKGGTIAVGKTPDGAFFVSDQGIGFDMTYAEKLFLPFERLVSNEQFPGSGIGLANVKRIIERHGGKIWAESEMGSGSTFRFTLEEGKPSLR